MKYVVQTLAQSVNSFNQNNVQCSKYLILHWIFWFDKNEDYYFAWNVSKVRLDTIVKEFSPHFLDKVKYFDKVVAPTKYIIKINLHQT